MRNKHFNDHNYSTPRSDIAHRVVATGRDPKSLAVSAVMTQDPIVISSNDDAMHALKKMVCGKFHHLPVVANGKVKGMVTVSQCLYDVIERSDSALYFYNQRQRMGRGAQRQVMYSCK